MKPTKARMNRSSPHSRRHKENAEKKPRPQPMISGEDAFLAEPERQTGITSGREKKGRRFVSRIE
jgi:hypothetical protein